VRSPEDFEEEIMPKKILFAAAGAALLLTAPFAWNAEATTLSVVGPLQTAVKDYSPN
jgi:hypothetical protein